MTFPKSAFCSIAVVAGLAAGIMGMITTCQADEFKLAAIGARGGFGANASSQDFTQVEAFADWNLPWCWALGRDWSLQTRLDSSAGWLGDQGANAGVFTLGPGLRLGKKGFPLKLEGGSNVTFLTNERFATKDFGSTYQFTSYGGVSLELGAHIRCGYRYQHMSNADLSNTNPGLNLHMFSISYIF
jgi:hypothetical protein